jgi:hypothetical protein
MYTNIDTTHALVSLHPFLQTLPLSAGCLANAIIAAHLDILMQQNVFKLGDAFWKKKWHHHGHTP